MATPQAGTAGTAAAAGQGGRGARGARESAILAAALDLVGEVGFDCVSMDAVAARARASKATIYRHWGGKGQLVADAVRCRINADIEPPSTGSLRGDLLAAVGLMADSMASVDGRLMMGLLVAKERDPELSRLLREQVHEAKRAVWQILVDRAVATGEVPAAAATATVDAVQEVLPAVAFFRYAALGLPLDGEWRSHVVDTVVMPLIAALPPVHTQPA